MNGYRVFYNGRELELYADTQYAAKLMAIELFKVPRSKESMITVVLCEVAGRQVETSTASL